MKTSEQSGKENGARSKGSAGGWSWLGMVSLVFGIVTVILAVGILRSGESSVAAAVGCGVIGVSLGILYLARNKKSGVVAGAGLWLSVAGLFLAVIAGTNRGVDTNITNGAGRNSGGMNIESWIGRASPDFTLVDIDGKRIQLSEMRGRRVMLDFWATWCPPCRIEIPFFVELRKSTSQDDLVMVGISDEAEVTVRSFAKDFKINYQLVVGSLFAMPIPYRNVVALPTTVFIDRKGIVQSVLVGAHDLDTIRAHALGPDYDARQGE